MLCSFVSYSNFRERQLSYRVGTNYEAIIIGKKEKQNDSIDFDKNSDK